MPEPGYLGFTIPYQLDRWWVDGAFVPAFPVTVAPSPGIFLLPTHGGTHIAQRPYRGSAKPASYDALSFTTTLQAIDDTTWAAMKAAKAKGAPFYFATGHRRTDYFAAVSGTTYRLTRPLASGIVTGVSDANYPTRINDAANGVAATVTGQNVVANLTGALKVEYTPASLVIFTAFPEEISAENALDAAVTMEEKVGA